SFRWRMNGIGRMTCTLAIGSSSYRIQTDICCVFSRISVQEDRPYSNTACTVMIAAFALIDDGVPALILEEERFNREKHTQEFPRYVVEPHAMPPRTRDQCRQVRCPLQSFRPRPSVVAITIEQDQRRLRLIWQEHGGPLKVPTERASVLCLLN